MLNVHQVEEEIREIIKSVSKYSDLKEEISFKKIGMDSLGIIRVLVEIQEKWDFLVEEENIDVQSLATIGEFVTTVAAVICSTAEASDA